MMHEFKRQGHEVAVSCFYGLQGGIIEFEGVKCYPNGGDPWGAGIAADHAAHFGADLIITLMDVWVLPPEFCQRWNTVFYLPIDHEPLPKNFMAPCQYAYKLVAFSEFGQRILKEGGLMSSIIPHMVDIKDYKPSDSTEIRKLWKVKEDDFVVGMMGINKGYPARKDFPHTFEAIAKLKKKYSNLKFYLHTHVGQEFQGYDINALLELYNIKDITYLPNPYMYMQGYDNEMMAKIFSSIDVLAAASMGEGFGLPTLEAQACGTPVVVTDFAASPEIVGDGATVKVKDKFVTGLHTYQVFPDADDMADKIEIFYKRGRGRSEKAVKFASKYAVEEIGPKLWKPFLDRTEYELGKEIRPNNDYVKLI